MENSKELVKILEFMSDLAEMEWDSNSPNKPTNGICNSCPVYTHDYALDPEEDDISFPDKCEQCLFKSADTKDTLRKAIPLIKTWSLLDG